MPLRRTQKKLIHAASTPRPALAPLVQNPKTLVVSVYYNRGFAVDDSIASLLGQDDDSLQFALVDDGSTDDTLERLRSASTNDPRVTIITHPNIGFVSSIRDAIAAFDTELVAIHGSGDISLPGRFKKQQELLQQDAAVGVVGCIVENVDEGTGRAELRPPGDMSLAGLFERSPFTQGEVMFRRDVYDRVGGYRQVFKFAQDYDLWLRMALVTNLGAVDDVLYRRFVRADGVSSDSRKLIAQQLLADFARQSVVDRLMSGEDWIDRYGELGLMFARPSRSTSSRLAKMARRHVLHNTNVDPTERFLAAPSIPVHTRDTAILHLINGIARWSPARGIELARKVALRRRNSSS